MFYALTFAFDLYTHAGLFEWLLYFIPVVYSFKKFSDKITILLGSIATVLIGTGLAIYPVAGDYSQPLLNRLLGITLLWITIFLYLKYRHSVEKLNLSTAQLFQQAKILSQQAEDLDRERHRLKYALREAAESQEFYRIIGETIPYGVWAADSEGGMIYFSQQMLDLLGLTMPEAKGRGWLNVLPKPEADALIETWAKSIKTGKMWDQEIKIPGKDGLVHTILSRGKGVLDSEGSVTKWVGINLDITERKRMEAQLEYNTMLLENVNDAIFAYDENYIIRSWNRAAEKMYGWRQDEALNRKITDILKTDVSYTQGSFLARKLQETGFVETEVTQFRKDGSAIEVDSHTRVLKDKNGKVIGCAAVNRDITDRKKAEEALREKDQRFRLAVDHFPFVFGIYDKDRRYRFMNAAGQKASGYKFHEFIGRRDEELFPKEMTDCFIPALKRTVESRQIQTIECQMNFDGRQIAQYITYVPLLNRKREVVEVLGLTIDITTRREIEELTNRKKEQAEVMSDISEALVRMSLDYDAVLEVTVEKIACLIGDACMLLMISDDEKFLRPLTLWHPDKQAEEFIKKRLIEHVQIVGEGVSGKVIKEGKAAIFPEITEDEVRANFKDEYIEIYERFRFFSLLDVPLRSYGRTMGSVLLIRTSPGKSYTDDDLEFVQNIADKAALAIENARLYQDKIHEIEERKIIEENLKNTLIELNNSNRELEQFAYVASHDLQEPLRMVATYTQLLSKKYQNRLDNKADEYIAFAVEGARRMHQLLLDLLGYSEVSRKSLASKPTDLNLVLRSALEDMKYLIHTSGANVTYSQLPVVKCYSDQIRQLFFNLIENAIKFSGGKKPLVCITSEEKEREWVFSVKDNGIGINPEYHERIFVIFQRLHQRSEYPGNGIGLALCKKIVERHFGRIWVESGSGQGAAFYFTIPKEDKEVPPVNLPLRNRITDFRN
ncbi:MAG: PAS domain S-box protein [Ignavibacteria bacterium]|jgi:PAS domain S-box-containing protein|nr:PAS domain S-box protein [Ignavibacteria bacterium]MCU7504736.1 PAS domain S-box protein [Ignavibacteria bacterium]MCU7516338.1 PAS domain S-box protein [Ignavibacteria bacterium]